MLRISEVENTNHLCDTRLPWNLQWVRNGLIILVHAGDQHYLVISGQCLIDSSVRSNRASSIATWICVFSVLLNLVESHWKLLYLFKACDLLLIRFRVVNLLRSCLRRQNFVVRVLAGTAISLIFINSKNYTWIIDGMPDTILRWLMAI
jgi:hypothetical protein